MDSRHFILSISSACLFAAAMPGQTPTVADRSYYTYGTGIGNGGFRISSVNGVAEILVPCGATGFNSGSRYWILHRRNAATNNYDQVFASPVYPETNPVVRTAVGEVDAAAGPELVFATRTGTIEVWNQASRTKLTTFNVFIGDIGGLGLGDVDADGDNDIVVCSASGLQARTATGGLVWDVPGATGSDLTIGQMDADPALEVALTSGKVIDCATRLVQWQWFNGFGQDVECADIDGDGRAEVIFAEGFNWTWAFDIDVGLPKWSLPMGDIDCITIANVDADANLEVLVGEGQWGDVRAYDTVTQQQDVLINNTEHGVTSVAAGDVDGDGQLEIVYGAGWTSSGPDYWYVAGAASQTIEWTSPALGSGFVGPVRGDIDGDGVDELVCAAPNVQSGGVRILMFDAATLVLEHLSQSITLGTFGGGSLSDIELADVDGNGDMEVFLVSAAVGSFNWSGTSFVQLWQVGGTSSTPTFRDVEVADLDGNGTLEVVLGSTQFAHVYSYGATAETWHSFYLGGEVRELAIGNSNITSEVEIHALSNDGNIYIFDGPTRAPKAILQDGGVDRKSIHLVAGLPAILAGDNNGHLFVYLHDGAGYLWIGPLPVTTDPITSLAWMPTLGLFRFSSGEHLGIHAGLTPVWLTANYGPGYAEKVVFHQASGQLATAGPFGVTVFDL